MEDSNDKFWMKITDTEVGKKHYKNKGAMSMYNYNSKVLNYNALYSPSINSFNLRIFKNLF